MVSVTAAENRQFCVAVGQDCYSILAYCMLA